MGLNYHKGVNYFFRQICIDVSSVAHHHIIYVNMLRIHLRSHTWARDYDRKSKMDNLANNKW